MEHRLDFLKVGQAGTVRFDLPVYTIGKGGPVLGITCSVHGDEQAGLFIVSRLLQQLTDLVPLDGTLHIVVAANPLAQILNSRVSPLDLRDLNRIGRGKEYGSITERIGAALFGFLCHCNFVVNIHEFEMRTPITAVFMNIGTTETKSKTMSAIRAFEPEIVWAINASRDFDAQYQSTLDSALALHGVANFPIETVQLPFLTDSEIEKVTAGFLRLLDHLEIVKTSTEASPTTIPAFVRQEITADAAGLWEPQLSLMRRVEVGEQVGLLTAVPDFERKKICSLSSGILVQCRHRQLVSTGTSLFSIGIDASEVLASY